MAQGDRTGSRRAATFALLTPPFISLNSADFTMLSVSPNRLKPGRKGRLSAGTEESPRAEALRFLYGTYQRFHYEIGLGA